MPLQWYMVCQDCGASISLSCKWEGLEFEKCEKCGGYNLKVRSIRVVDLDKKPKMKTIQEAL